MEAQLQIAPTSPQALIGPAGGAFQLEVFLDLANIEYSARRLGCRKPDLAALLQAAVREFAVRLGGQASDGLGRQREASKTRTPPTLSVVCRRVWCVCAEPANVHPADARRLEVRRRRLVEIEEQTGFTMLKEPLNFHGFRLCAGDRRNSVREAEREWRPAEKGTDVRLGTHMVTRAQAIDRPDGMILVGGDGDLASALRQLQEAQSPVRVMVAGFAHSLSRVFFRNNPVGYEWDMEPIVLDPYLTPAPGKGNVRVASLEVIRAVGEVQTKEDTRMVRVATGGAGGSGIGAQRGVVGMRPADDLEVGRIAVNRPRRGELHVYCKRDGATGSTVLCEEDGGKYGVALGVLKRFPEVGTYVGWAYVDVQRGLAFRFVLGEAAAEPDSLLAIDTSDGRVEAPPSSTAGVRFEHGALVAFYWRFASRNGDGRPRRQATRVYGLDRAHLPLIARLIANGWPVFPEHAEVLDTFFGGVTDADVPPQDAARFREALDRLAADPGVPSGFQVMARVERARLVSGGSQTSTTTAPQGPPAVPPEGKAKGKSRRAGKPGGYNLAAGDVSPLDLQVD
jgi:hypothetical protein